MNAERAGLETIASRVIDNDSIREGPRAILEKNLQKIDSIDQWQE